MPRYVKIIFSVSAFLLFCGLVQAFPLWLDAPTRSNTHDPRSPLFPAITPTPANTPTAVPTPTPAGIWCDFETDVSSGLWYPAPGWPSPGTTEWSNDTAVSGTHSWKIQVGAGASWGHWMDLDINPAPILPAGLTMVELWVKIDQDLTTELHIIEGTTTGDGQTWWRNMVLTGDSSWHLITLPLGSFFPTVAGGDGIIATDDLISVWMYHLNPYPANTMYIDDIRFY